VTGIESQPLAFTENSAGLPVSSVLTLSDVDDTQLESARVIISSNFRAGQDRLEFIDQAGISGSYDALTGELTLTGTADVADYQAALRSVLYANDSEDPSGLVRTIEISVNDGMVESNIGSRDIVITTTNDAPVLLSIENTIISYVENQAPVLLTDSLVVADSDDSTLQSASISIVGNYTATQDVLTFTSSGSISGNFDSNAGTLLLTGAATTAEYESYFDAA